MLLPARVSRYSITAGTSDRPIALADGKLTTSTVQKHDFVKYSFYVDQMESDVDVVITPQVSRGSFFAPHFALCLFALSCQDTR